MNIRSDQRLAALEARVEFLESLALGGVLSEPGGSEDGDVDNDGDRFFALTALKERLPESGGVIYSGAVTLPGGQRAEWQYGLPTESILEQEWAGQADILAALGHPVRLRIVQEIVSGRASVGELTRIDGVGTSGQVYHHLRQLVAAGWLQSTSRGQYEVPAARLVPLLTTILAARR